MGAELSAVIPVLDEEETIGATLAALRLVADGDGVQLETIVVDGREEANTIQRVDDPAVVTFWSAPGRGVQMNAGARRATAPVLLFLHADTLLPPRGLRSILELLEDELLVGGAFDLGIDAPGAGYRLIESAASLRSRLTRIPYGDQAIFLRRPVFEALGGYAPIPLMEDVELMRRLKQRGLKVAFLPTRVRTSARRWQRLGPVRATLRNWRLMALYLLGVAPERLAGWYQGGGEHLGDPGRGVRSAGLRSCK